MTGTANFGLEPCFWGSVNTWECDENDHQNVRFFPLYIFGMLSGPPTEAPYRLS